MSSYLGRLAERATGGPAARAATPPAPRDPSSAGERSSVRDPFEAEPLEREAPPGEPSVAEPAPAGKAESPAPIRDASPAALADAPPPGNEEPDWPRDGPDGVTTRIPPEEPIRPARPPEPPSEPPPPAEPVDPRENASTEEYVAPAPPSETHALSQPVAEEPPAMSPPSPPPPLPQRLEQVVTAPAAGREVTAEGSIAPLRGDEGSSGAAEPLEQRAVRTVHPPTPALADEPTGPAWLPQAPPISAEPRDDRLSARPEAAAAPAAIRPAEPPRVLPRPAPAPAESTAPPAPALEIGELSVEVVPPVPPPRAERPVRRPSPEPRARDHSAARSQLRFGLRQI